MLDAGIHMGGKISDVQHLLSGVAGYAGSTVKLPRWLSIFSRHVVEGNNGGRTLFHHGGSKVL